MYTESYYTNRTECFDRDAFSTFTNKILQSYLTYCYVIYKQRNLQQCTGTFCNDISAVLKKL